MLNEMVPQARERVLGLHVGTQSKESQLNPTPPIETSKQECSAVLQFLDKRLCPGVILSDPVLASGVASTTA